MRAVVIREFGDIDSAAFGEMPKPELKAGDVLLQVKSTAVNFVDLVTMSGTYQVKPQLPFVPGKLPAGVVAALGAGVTQFKPGDHAIAMAEQGGFAEFVVMPEDQCVQLPPSLPFDEAAAMSLIFDTAYFALRDRARIKPGESALVLGATGGVGLAAIQLVKAMGGVALAGVASKDKESIVRDAGADHVIDLAASDLQESLRAQVFEKVGRQGVDIVIDMLGGDYFDAAVRALAWCGRLVVIGFASGRIPSIKANYFLVKNIEISGMQISDYRKRRPADMQACFRQIFEWHAAGKLKPLPTKVYPLEQFAEAMRDIRDRRQRGRVVLSQAG